MEKLCNIWNIIKSLCKRGDDNKRNIKQIAKNNDSVTQIGVQNNITNYNTGDTELYKKQMEEIENALKDI